LLYWYKSIITEKSRISEVRARYMLAQLLVGSQFTEFTAQFTCFTCTKAQRLTSV
jgi:hypothetical protein